MHNHLWNRESRILGRGREDPLGPPPARKVAAAKKLARRGVRKRGYKRLMEIASKGGTNTWKDLTPLERSIEMRRRRRVGLAKERAEKAALIRAQLGRK